MRKKLMAMVVALFAAVTANAQFEEGQGICRGIAYRP